MVPTLEVSADALLREHDKSTFIPDINELRIILTDESFVDVWFSLKLQSRYSFHVMAPLRMRSHQSPGTSSMGFT